MVQDKTCSRCNTLFQCGATETSGHCWCNNYPPLFKPDPLINCMCSGCLHKATKEKVDAYVAEMTIEKALMENKAKELPATKNFIEGIDYYFENKYWVFTAWHHLKRGIAAKAVACIARMALKKLLHDNIYYRRGKKR